MSFVKHTGNKVYGSLVNLAFGFRERYWIEGAPPQVHSLLIVDVHFFYQ